MTLPEKLRLGCCFLALGAILTLQKGYLTLCREGCPPQVLFPCAPATLPADARAALEAGIPVRNDLELAHILEDYLS